MRIPQAWLLGLIDRVMSMRKGHNLIGSMAYNVYHPTEEGESYLQDSYEIKLPQVTSCQQARISSQPGKSIMAFRIIIAFSFVDNVRKRKGKGCQIVTTIHHLMSSSSNWFTVKDKNDYRFPGICTTPYPQRLGFCDNVSTLHCYDSHNPHFLFTDIQFGKGKACNAQKVLMNMNDTSKTVWYRVVPCGGVRICSTENCEYVTSIKETRPCELHQDKKLIRSNEKYGDCPAEFVYT